MGQRSPVCIQLRKFAIAVIHSTTKLLPAWYNELTQLELPAELMPRDVRTRWNSTYEMLSFALQFRDAIDGLTSNRSMDLRHLELDDGEWRIVSQLCDILKVSVTLVPRDSSDVSRPDIP